MRSVITVEYVYMYSNAGSKVEIIIIIIIIINNNNNNNAEGRSVRARNPHLCILLLRDVKSE